MRERAEGGVQILISSVLCCTHVPSYPTLSLANENDQFLIVVGGTMAPPRCPCPNHRTGEYVRLQDKGELMSQGKLRLLIS